MTAITIITRTGDVRLQTYTNEETAKNNYNWLQQNMRMLDIKKVEIETPTYYYATTIER